MNQKGFIGILVLIVVSTAVVAGGIYFFKSNYGKECGGIAGNLPERQCSPGFVCKLDGNYPDAAGKCTNVLSSFIKMTGHSVNDDSKFFWNVPAQSSPRTQTSEHQKIEIWIKNNGLNEYGDPRDTVYAGGTPLFDEKTGKTIDRYQYIINKHPDKPWNK